MQAMRRRTEKLYAMRLTAGSSPDISCGYLVDYMENVAQTEKHQKQRDVGAVCVMMVFGEF